MKTANGAAHGLNGHGLNGHGQNGHRPYTLAPIKAKRDAIISWIQDNELKLSLFAYVILALLFVGGVNSGLIHIKPTPDPYSAIKTQIDNIDLDRPKHDIRNELDKIESDIDDLRPQEEPDRPTIPGGV
jgi:hypothetical protein